MATKVLLAFVSVFALSQGATLWSWSSETHNSDIHSVLKSGFGYGTERHGQFGIGSDDSLSLAEDPENKGHYVLRVFYKKGTFSSHNSHGDHCDSAHGEKCHRGAQLYITPSALSAHTHTTITLEYEVYFDGTFGWQRGGKLPGLFGGSRDCSGGRISDHCFSARLMWRSSGDGEVYTYVTHDGQQPSFSEWCHKYDQSSVPTYKHLHCGGKGLQVGTGAFRFQHNHWTKIRQEVHLNTRAGQPGYIKLWVNGHAEIHITDIVMRANTDFAIDGIFFSSFYGGGDTSWACPHDTYTYFRNFRLSTDTSTPSQSQLVG